VLYVPKDARQRSFRLTAALILVASLGLADSINPVTILVAAYLGVGADPRPRLAGFAAGVFGIYLLGGLVLLFGPGELLHTALRGPKGRGFDVATLVVGGIVIVAAVVLWLRRASWAHPELPARMLRPGSALALGAVVTAIDLPTAFPYFAAIAAIVSAGVSRAEEIILLVVFNALYVLPLVLLLVAQIVLGARFELTIIRVRSLLDRIGATVLVGLTLAVGVVLVVKGATGLWG